MDSSGHFCGTSFNFQLGKIVLTGFGFGVRKYTLQGGFLSLNSMCLVCHYETSVV